MEDAPFYSDIIRDAAPGAAYWLRTTDNVRIRMGVWNKTAEKGTVLLFPGRTEYIEKYAHTAAEFAAGGYATAAIDWRNQGVADRLSGDPMVGHVGKFSDFQLDVAAAVKAAETLELPKPWFLLGHSMGGCIGLRALMEGLPVNAASFTGPMWGILLPPSKRALAVTVSSVSRVVGLSSLRAPGTSPNAYVLEDPFKDNMLTTDPDMFALMQEQLKAEPDLSLGGPSLNWIYEALRETSDLAKRPSPSLPCLTFLGSNERIVDPQNIHDRMAAWPNGTLNVIDTGEHEILMEREALRSPCTRDLLAFYDANLVPPEAVKAG